MTTYTSTRPRGFAPWRPHRRTEALLDQVGEVLAEYEEHLPLTARQLFYRLVANHDYPKSDHGYGRLLETLSRARRAGRVSFDAIRDDGATAQYPPHEYPGLPEFWQEVASAAKQYRLPGLLEQDRAVEVWVEAAGMVPQVAKVAHDYGVPVFSSGGFDSLTVKYDAACRIVDRDRPTVVLHVGDHDPSGVALFDAAAADVAQLAAGLAADVPAQWVRFRRVAVTPEQINAYGLPESPAKASDRRGDWTGGTVQAEALSPDTLADIVRQAVERQLDLRVLAETRVLQAEQRAEIVAALRAGGLA